MLDFSNHTYNGGRVSNKPRMPNFSKAKAFKNSSLMLCGTDDTPYLLNANHDADSSSFIDPLTAKRSDTLRPLFIATVRGVSMDRNASRVALMTLCGLDEFKDLATIS